MQGERGAWRRWSGGRAAPTSHAQALALRCRIVLAAAEGTSNKASPRCSIAIRSPSASGAGASAQWRLDGLQDEPRPGAPRTITDAQVEAVIVTTLEEQPPNATHWSTRSMAAALGMSQSAISRIWRAFGLKPHLVESFNRGCRPTRSSSTRFVTWPGSISTRPTRRLCCAWTMKTQIQALDRTAPTVPMMPGVPARGGDARLHPSRHDEPLRGARCRFGMRDHGDDPPAPGSGVPAVPHPHRPQRSP